MSFQYLFWKADLSVIEDEDGSVICSVKDIEITVTNDNDKTLPFSSNP